MNKEEFQRFYIANLPYLINNYWIKNIKDIYNMQNSHLILKYIKSEIEDLEEVNNKILSFLNSDNNKIRKEIVDMLNEKVQCLEAKFKESYRPFASYEEYIEYNQKERYQEDPVLSAEYDYREFERSEKENMNIFISKHKKFRSIFNDCYEDKNLDLDMKVLENYLKKNNMLSPSLAISRHALVVVRAKLAVAKNKELIQNLVISKEENNYKTDKDYSRYEIIGVNPAFIKSNLSKRKLPTEIFTYLISNNILKEKDISKYSINQFGRTFETKMGDIILPEELPQDEKRQIRYNKVDFSFYPKSDFQGILYFSNQWSKDSIDKLINNIELNFGKYLSIITPEVANVVAYAYDEKISQIEKD